jgi:hypothetical protein|tara:strand:+ start:417 stop:590 length:174 start_codon:yes stop_codon:yes gene_type:complete
MTQVKNCYKLHNCKCADDLRKNLLKLPISEYDEIQIEKEIQNKQKIYHECLAKNTFD